MSDPSFNPQDLAAEFDKLRDIAEAEMYPAAPWPWSFIALGLGLLVVIGLLWRWWKRRQAQEPPPVILSPAQKALKSLDALKHRQLIDQGLVKEFTYEVNIVLRHYLEDQFSIRAPEQTTEEFLASPDFQKTLAATQKEALKSFLEFCDQIKYANFQPGRQETEGLLERARQFIRQSEFALDSVQAQGDS